MSFGSTHLRIFKAESVLDVWEAAGPAQDYELVESIPVLAWSGELGPKLAEGDLQAPEGFYEVSAESLNPQSRFHRSFDLGFPNAYDRARGRTGSFLMVHGGRSRSGVTRLATRRSSDCTTGWQRRLPMVRWFRCIVSRFG
jgi:murein L,D-transpeptidase YafK